MNNSIDSTVRRAGILLTGLLMSLVPACGTADLSAGDVQTSGREAVGYLADYLKIDTTNPPGNEALGAQYLASVFSKNGIEAKVFEATSGRSCVYARLAGNGKKRPIVLLNHIDVVPANASDWEHHPFKGEVHNGEIWGRGAIDMKGMGIAELEAMLMIKRSSCKLNRDLIFLATPDEEVGGSFGANWFTANHPELIKDAEFLLNEGFFIETDENGKARYWGVDIGEKNVLWLKLTAHGSAGHASMPISDSATNRLVRALDKVISRPPQVLVLPAVEEYYKDISTSEIDWRKQAYADIAKAVQDPALLSKLMQDRLKSSMLVNTVSLTVLQAGYKTNVIPAEASAQLDCRLLPGVDNEKFTAAIKSAMDDSSIDVAPLEWQHTGSSPYDTELFSAIKAVAAREAPGTPVVPMFVPWFTDSHWFRDLGIVCYGFAPFKIDLQHLATMHGNNERIPITVFTDGVHCMYEILRQVAAD